MNKYEQELMDALLEEYQEKGYNPQAILSNSLFQQLSIEAKISLLRNNLEKLTSKPTLIGAMKPSKGLQSSLMAGLGGVITGISMSKITNKPFSLAAGIGSGLLGAAAPALSTILKAKSDLKKDLKTRQQLQENKYYRAVIGRSNLGLDKPTPNPIIKNISDKVRNSAL